MVIPESIQKLIKKFSQFPGIGPKQAARFVFFLLGAEKQYRTELLKDIQTLNALKSCISCNLISENELCPLCANQKRNHQQICIVEKTSDLLTMERSGAYHGTYYILETNAINNKKINLTNLKKRITKLLEQNSNGQIEIILATNPTTEGEATALYIEKELLSHNTKITRLARGLPSGAEIEYIDQTTLQSALENRKDIKK